MAALTFDSVRLGACNEGQEACFTTAHSQLWLLTVCDPPSLLFFVLCAGG